MLSKINYNHMFIIVNSVIYFNGKLSIDIREGPGFAAKVSLACINLQLGLS